MKVIIAGPRWTRGEEWWRARNAIVRGMSSAGWLEGVSEVVSGGADGVDRAGEVFAEVISKPVQRFPADWSLGKRAGPMRNREMAAYADALLAIWDGKSKGTLNMINAAHAAGIPVWVEMLPRKEP